MLSFTEDTFEQAVIELFENMGYTHIYAPDMNRTDYNRPLLDDVLRDCLVRLNRSLPAVAIDEAILKLNDFDAGSLLQKNIILDRKSTRLNSSHTRPSRMPSSA